jgi:tetratricopeptide (TPR) repeat protein
MLVALLGCGGGGGRAHTPADQINFGVRMAERGLWSEALFRFQQAQRLGGNDAEVLNNLAVAHEALGRFDEALDFYRQALALAPGNRDLKANYDRFVSFYESFRAQAQPAEGQAGGAAPAEPPVDAGSPGPPAGPGGEDQPLIPGTNEPPPVPDPDDPSDPPPPRAGAVAGGADRG